MATIANYGSYILAADNSVTAVEGKYNKRETRRARRGCMNGTDAGSRPTAMRLTRSHSWVPRNDVQEGPPREESAVDRFPMLAGSAPRMQRVDATF